MFAPTWNILQGLINFTKKTLERTKNRIQPKIFSCSLVKKVINEVFISLAIRLIEPFLIYVNLNFDIHVYFFKHFISEKKLLRNHPYAADNKEWTQIARNDTCNVLVKCILALVVF